MEQGKKKKRKKRKKNKKKKSGIEWGAWSDTPVAASASRYPAGMPAGMESDDLPSDSDLHDPWCACRRCRLPFTDEDSDNAFFNDMEERRRLG